MLLDLLGLFVNLVPIDCLLDTPMLDALSLVQMHVIGVLNPITPLKLAGPQGC